ncbi:MAG: histidine kinase [Thioalkalispiraceae bacterium]|jgi:signal transduction histidine kinase
MAELDLDLNPETNPEYNAKKLLAKIDRNSGDNHASSINAPLINEKKKKELSQGLRLNQENDIPHNVISIIEAKHEWESTVDCLHQLAIILLDKNLNIIRANKTMENWGWGEVSSVTGQNVYDLLEPIISPQKHDEFYRVWLTIDANSITEWESKFNTNGRIYRFSFYPVHERLKSNHRKPRQKPYLALVIEDITEKKQAVVDLKHYVSELELELIRKNQKLVYAKKRLEQRLKKEALTTNKLRQSKEQLHLLSNQLINAQEKERKNVSRELHDGIGQILSAIKYQIEGALLASKTGNEEVATSTSSYVLDEVLANVKAAFVEVRRVSMNLRPSMLDELGVITTLEWFFRDFNKVYTDLVIDQQISLSEGDVPENAKIVIFRIVQEAMNNSAKYAKASQIRVQLFKKENTVILRIIDDGQGFDIKTTEQQHKFGIGLKSMKERADSIDGELRIRSTINAGTMVELKFNVS